MAAALRSFRKMDSVTMRYFGWFVVLSSVLLVFAGISGCRGPSESASADVSASVGATQAEQAALLKQRGQAHLEAGEYNDAFVAFKRASQLVNDDYDIAWGMAQANAKLGNEVGALDSVNLALGLRPESAEAMELQGRVFLRLGRTGDAIRVLKRTVEKHPDHTLAWLNLSAAYRASGDIDKAVQAARGASKADPESATPHFALGDIYLRDDKLDLAEQQYRAAIRKDPEHAASYMRLADLYIVQKKDLNQARTWALKSDSIEPGDGTAASAAAWVLFLQDRKFEAANEVAEAAEDHPQNYLIWMRLGEILEAMGEDERADKARRTAAQFAPRVRSLIQDDFDPEDG